MRASRLLSLLLMLQARGRLTAQELADALEVSVRTVYRDVDALSASGVPIHADRGPDGGYSLPEGYRAQRTGMTGGSPGRAPRRGVSGEEAGSPALAGTPAAAAELGLVLATAQLTVHPALPAELAERTGRIAERFHLDAPGWFREADHVPTLTGIADAVWNQRVLRLCYHRWGDEEVTREVEPLGVVLKAGTWYLVAAPHDAHAPGRAASWARTYRVARILGLETLDVRFPRPAGFDLWRYWNGCGEVSAPGLYHAEAAVRVSPGGMAAAADVLRPHTARALSEHPWPVDDAGWTCAVIPIESLAHARTELLALGAEIEVVSPAPLRERMGDTAAGLAALYAT